MSTAPTEPTSSTPPTEPSTTPAAPAPETPPPAQGTDWKAEARKWEGLAKANNAAAKKLAEIEEASKTETQKLADQLATAQREAAAAKREAFAAKKGIPAELITGSTQEEWDAAAAKALEWKGAQAAQPTPPPPAANAHAAGNNGAPVGSPGDIDAQIAEAEKARNFTLAIALKRRKFEAAKAN